MGAESAGHAEVPLPRLPTPESVAPLAEVVRRFAERGWLDGDWGNFSLIASREPMRLWISLAGRDRRRLGPEDFVLVDAAGKPCHEDSPEPPPEAHVHGVLAEHLTQITCIVHTQSPWAELLTDRPYPQNNLPLDAYETIRGLTGMSPASRVNIKVFDQPQHWHELVRRLRLVLPENSLALRFGFFLKRHGLYAWGRDPNEARRHVETIEHLLDLKARLFMLTGE
ncbi:MAG TPA: class II aldolase/adducin family protein [Gemmatales bacterium]|nr:class II aldolase/adducin family protein [Gemmatales bacterium]